MTTLKCIYSIFNLRSSVLGLPSFCMTRFSISFTHIISSVFRPRFYVLGLPSSPMTRFSESFTHITSSVFGLRSSVLKLLLIFTISNILYCNISSSQQLPLIGHSYENPYLFNPCEAGNNEYVNAYLLGRNQWKGIQNAPETYLLSIDGALDSRKVGLGLIIYSDVTDIIGRKAGYASYRYQIKLADNQNLRLGLSAGFLQNTIYFDRIRVDQTNDATLLANYETRTTFDANLGITYNYENLKMSISSYQLFNNGYDYENNIDFKELKYRLIRHYYFSVSYKQLLNNDFRLDPQLMFRNVHGMPLQFDVSTFVNWRDQAWIGPVYKHNYGVGISLGGVVYQNIELGYSYDIPTGNIRNYTTGTHEIIIGIRLYRNSNKPPTRNEYNPDEFDRLKRYNDEQYQDMERLKQENEQLKREMEKNREEFKQQKEELLKLQQIFENDKDAIRVAVNKYKFDMDEFDKMDMSENKEEQFYVVLGAYLRIEDAKFFQKILKREANLETIVIEREDGKYFFVCSVAYTKNENVKKDIYREFKRLEKLGIQQYVNGNIWVYKSGGTD